MITNNLHNKTFQHSLWRMRNGKWSYRDFYIVNLLNNLERLPEEFKGEDLWLNLNDDEK